MSILPYYGQAKLLFNGCYRKKILILFNIMALGLLVCIAGYKYYLQSINKLSDEITKELQTCEVLLQTNQCVRAIQKLNNYMLKDKSNQHALNMLGYCHQELEQYDLAINYYKEVLRFAPKHLSTYLNLGNIYLKNNDLDSAEFYLEKLNKLCKFGCLEYDTLKINIENVKQ